MRDAHVIGHDIQHLAKMVLAKRIAELLVANRAAQLSVDALMIETVVAVRAAGGSLKIGRAVHVADAQSFEIIGDFRGFLETEPWPQLKAVSGSG
jgi:hypothetical protein